HLLHQSRFYAVPWLDPIVSLTYVAATTSRLRLGTSVLVLPTRHPVVLAKQIATLQALADERYILGAGTGWDDREFQAVGQRRAGGGGGGGRAGGGHPPAPPGGARGGSGAGGPPPGGWGGPGDALAALPVERRRPAAAARSLPGATRACPGGSAADRRLRRVDSAAHIPSVADLRRPRRDPAGARGGGPRPGHVHGRA